MNKKAAIFHWIIFGIMAAVGIFLMVGMKDNLSGGVKGDWQLQFLEENYFVAESQLLRLDGEAQVLGNNILTEMAGLGGFKEKSECGQMKEVNLWNNGAKWCLPEVETIAAEKAQEKLTDYTQLVFKENIFYGIGGKKEIKSKIGSYWYDQTFKVELSNSLNEYALLFQKAKVLVTACSGEKELKACLDPKLKDSIKDWQYTSCQDGKYENANRQVPFCVQFGDLQYKFALDFSSAQPFKVDTLVVENDAPNNRYTLSFVQDVEADSYKIYYTDWKEVKERKGTVEDVFNGFSSAFSFKEELDVNEPAGIDCPVEKEAGKAYLCVDGQFKVVYIIEDARIVPGKTFVAVTAIRNGLESEIANFVQLGLMPIE